MRVGTLRGLEGRVSMARAQPFGVVRLSGDGADGGVEADLDPDAVVVAADDACLERGFFVVADEHDVARLGVEGRVVAAWAVADPGLHDEVGSDGRGVVPEVVLAVAHVLIVLVGGD